MKFDFTHENLKGTFSESFLTGKQILVINGQEIQKTGKEWATQGNLHIQSKKKFLLFPGLIINGKEVKLVNLKKWEWFFVFLPGFLIFLGGALPALFGFAGMYLNLSIFKSSDIKPAIKVLASLGYLIIAIVIILGISAALQPQS